MMSASALSSLLASSSNLTIMLRLLEPLKSTGVTLDTGEVTMRGNCQNPWRNSVISVWHRWEGKDKEPYEYLNCNFPHFLQLTPFFFCTEEKCWEDKGVKTGARGSNQQAAHSVCTQEVRWQSIIQNSPYSWSYTLIMTNNCSDFHVGAHKQLEKHLFKLHNFCWIFISCLKKVYFIILNYWFSL